MEPIPEETLRRPLPVFIFSLRFPVSTAIVVALSAGVVAPTAGAQVAPPPPGAGQPSSYVIDAGQVAPTAVSTTSKAPAKKKNRPTTTTTISAKVLELDTAPVAAPAAVAAGAIPPSVWAALRKCESNENYAINTGNGYYGAYQFAAGTWRKLGFSGLPHEAAPSVQDEAARKLQASAGWGQWPACSRKLGLR